MFQAGVNVSGRYRKWPVFSRPLMAGFGRPPRIQSRRYTGGRAASTVGSVR